MNKSMLGSESPLTSSQGEPEAKKNQSRKGFKSCELTRRSKHLLASEDSIGTGHEAHGLFRFSQSVPPCGKANYRGGEDNTSCSNGANESVVLYGL